MLDQECGELTLEEYLTGVYNPFLSHDFNLVNDPLILKNKIEYKISEGIAIGKGK